ncbi:hypothetical protein BC826DRAFT_1110047 [Russula brevipes]|nr:hypothetical protein BC826DRAFT_1110047 [Russula brevipes]
MYVNSPTSYESYLPQRFYRPASHYLDDEPSSAFAFDGLAYSPSFHAFPPQIDTETAGPTWPWSTLVSVRQRSSASMPPPRLPAASAHLPFKPRLDASSASSTRDFYARRLKTGLLDASALSSALSWMRTPTKFPFLSITLSEIRHHSFSTYASPCEHDEEVLSVGELLGLLAGIRPETQPISTPERHTLRTPSEFHRPAEPQSQPPKHNDTPVASKEFLEFLHGIASQSRAAAECRTKTGNYSSK